MIVKVKQYIPYPNRIVIIYFVSKTDNDSQIREIKLQENGAINPISWPKDFFGESLKEALTMASEQAKRKKI